jgi:hypothetical protein
LTESWFTAVYTIGGAILGALLTAFVQPIWAALLGKKSKIVAEAKLNSFQIPQYFVGAISEYEAMRWHKGAKMRPTNETIERFRKIRLSSGYIELTIKNESKSEIHGIIVSIGDNAEVIFDCETNGDSAPSDFSKSYKIESLMPKSKCVLKIWTYSDISERSFQEIEKIINLTAKQYDNINIKYDPGLYLTSNYHYFRRNILFKSIMTSFIAIFIIFNIIAIKVK